MTTTIRFFKNGRSVKAGLEVTIQWEGYNSWNPFGGGHAKHRTDSSGAIYVDEGQVSGRERKTDNIYIENPDGGYSLKYPNYVITKGAEHQLHLEQAVRQ
jgi:hypothetical protein